MIDHEKVIKGLECCLVQSDEVPPLCEECPYCDEKVGSCEYFRDILSDALALLKEHEDSIPLKPLAAWLAGYAAPPKDAMRAAMQDGHITPGILRQAWEQTLREIRWDDIE